MEKLKTHALHPVLVAVYPVLALYAANFGQVRPADVLRSLVVCAAFSGLVLGFFWLVKVERRRAAAAVSVTLIFFFSFLHIYAAVQHIKGIGPLFSRVDVFVAVWAAAWILITWFILRILKDITPLTVIFNTAAIVLCAGVSFSLAAGAAAGAAAVLTGKTLKPVDMPMPEEALSPLGGGDAGPKPDIYYIILDSYPREDILRRYFNYDNSELLDFLRERGFYIADRSTSNYSQTAVSLASSLNFDYLNDFTEKEGIESANYHLLRSLIQHNRARQFLEGQGYQFIAFETGYVVTDITDADRYIHYGLPLNPFEMLLLKNSLAAIFLDQTFAARYRSRIIQTFRELSNLPDASQPKFVFAHIMAAHAPFVFGPDGEVVDANSYSLEGDGGDSSNFPVQEELRLGQITYMNRLLMQTIDAILENSKNKPVIILQADHGSDRYMDWQSADNTCFTERMAIFNAYYFPDQQTGLLYKSITPINTFRAVLNTYFGTNLPLLEDRNYFYIWARPYDYLDVTGVEGSCP